MGSEGDIQVDSLIIAASWLDLYWWWAVAQVVLGLGAVIFVHELGHFLVAKACGVKCEKFYVGFDFFDIKIGDRVLIPRSLVKWTWGETEYGIGIIPLGGYVKMLGQDDNPGNIEKEIQRSQLEDPSDENNDGNSEKSNTSSAPDYTLAQGLVDREKIDPRSFLAKSVPQRMAIISAGVVFNIIFAIIFAAIAFRSSVNYEPPVIGNVISGGPAWKADLTGARITKIGDKAVEGYFTYINMAEEIVFSDGKPIKLEYEANNSTVLEEATITPKKGLVSQLDIPLIGVQPAMTPKVGFNATTGRPTIEGNAAFNAVPAFKKNDVIKQLDGKNIESGFALRSHLARFLDREVQFQVLRLENGQPTELTIPVAANPRRELGFTTKWLEISDIQDKSPGAEAGFKAGDVILQIAGNPRGDLFTLDQRMTQIARDNQRPVEFLVQRGDQQITLSVEPRLPRVIPAIESNRPVAIDTLGLAINISDEIETSNVEGIVPGDTIADVEFVLTAKQQNDPVYSNLVTNRSLALDSGDISWAGVYSLMQQQPAGATLKLGLQRDGETTSTKITTTASKDFFLHTRGIILSQLQNTYTSPTWGDAIAVGSYQTWYDASRVWRFLKKLVSGKISASNLGGPGTIAMAATSEATRGTSRLLLFLTLLSANLAIVNFLPIPVLDGGHMLFLAYEGIFRRPVSEKAQILLTYAGLILILALMLFVVYLDIGRFASL